MKKYLAQTDLFRSRLSTHNQTIIDVGCGNGDTVRWLASQGARVTGLDSAEMLAKARQVPPWGTEEYIEGVAQKLPFADKSADAILFQASFHHVPAVAMAAAALECRRVLKNGGRAVFVEPVYRAGAYTEITRLVGDEEEIQKKAKATIVSMAGSGMTMEKEEFFYVERSFADYIHLLELHIDDAIGREAILTQARKITEEYSAAAGMDFTDFRYRSICRLNILINE
jgi:ubiquinone/menaquinone biosynthesis C-methylase UbiE